MSEDLPSTTIIGRFAPSPTGPLHFGSLVAAVASYLEARGGQWLLRIEDVDRPRAVAGMAEQQMDALRAYGFMWDGQVMRQSKRESVYQDALQKLIAAGMAYPCVCTRSQLANHADRRIGIDGACIYPGTCSSWKAGDAVPAGAAWRFRVGGLDALEWSFEDRIQGKVSQQLARDVGDFVVHRADGCTTYQLAVVVDDLAQGINQIVRGDDLIDSTARQLALISALGGRPPSYAHVPVVVNDVGEKLSKQTLAQALPVDQEADRVAALWAALEFLGQAPPANLGKTSQQALWDWAKAHWAFCRVPRVHGQLLRSKG